ncbi:MAG: hypothetical protein ACF8K1_11470 [Phycisphaerales bacterium JB047]
MSSEPGRIADEYPMRTCQGRSTHTTRRGTLAAAILCAISGLAQAQNEIEQNTTRPSAAGRVVRAFDFEEQDTNPLPVPLGWIRAQDDPAVPRVRPGFPIWNHAKLDYQAPAFAGKGSVMLPTNGGSTSLQLRYGELSIFPNADYLVSARVRTHGVEHASAQIVATLLDQHGVALDSTRVESRLVQSEGEWTQVSIELEGLDPSAAYMQIELLLLQPQQQEQNKEQAFKVWEQDYEGAAWFDNLIVAQLPRLEITTGSPGNIVVSEDPPNLQVLVRDLTGEQISANLRIFDVHTRLVHEESLSDDRRRVHQHHQTSLPGYGWYRALLEVVADNRVVGVRTLDFIWAPPDPSDTDSGMFSVQTPLTHEKLAEATPALVDGAGVDRVALRVWDQRTTLEDLNPSGPRFSIINQLLNTGTQVSFTLAQLPTPLATDLAIDPDEVLNAFSDPNGPWTKWGAQMFDQYGQRVTALQFGITPTLESPVLLERTLADARRALAGFVPGPTTILTWPIDRPIPSQLATPGNTLQISDDQTTASEAISSVVDEWVRLHTESTGADESPARLGMDLRPLRQPETQRGMQAWSATSALARRAITFWWAAGSSGLDRDRFELRLCDAWWVSEGKRGQVMPAPELLMWRTLAKHLSNRTPLEQVDLLPGVRMLVISPPESQAGRELDLTDDPGGALVLWLDEPSIDPVTLKLPLANAPVRVFDVMGNETRVDPIATGNIGVPMHHIPISRSPIIVEGVNAELVRLLGSLQLTPDMLESRSGLHNHHLTISNPWDIPISGRVFIVEPGGYTGDPGEIDRSWEILPRTLDFNLSPGETRDLPVDFAYSLGELAGEKKLVFDVELHADQNYPMLRVERTIELGLTEVEMVLSAKRNDAGITVVSVDISHSYEREQHFELIAIAPNESRIRRTINALSPDKTVTRQFAFTKPVPGDEIVVVLLPRESSTRLNKSVIVP